MAAGTISRIAHDISKTPSAPHPPRESAPKNGSFATASKLNTLYAPPARDSRASATWRTHKRTFIGQAPLLLPGVPGGEGRALERIRLRHEADERGGGVGRHVELVDLQRVDREEVAVRPVSRGRAGAAEARRAEIGPSLLRALGQSGLAAAGALGQLLRGRRDVVDDPVPPAGAGRRVGIVDREDEALRAGRRVRPGELG